MLAAAESLRAASELVGASAVSAVCAALGAAAADEDLDAAWAFLPSLLLHCRRFAAELDPFAEVDTVRAAVGAAAG